ncbi:MAG TPA: IPT/TIG domain-containing protein [Thermoanaerobaculia bacterium]|jgi:plastocyanin|nr:IPT/TIG domain-containing protein [Thermoanaerobaculia bacterium]
MNGWWVVSLMWIAAIAPHDSRTFNVTARQFTFEFSPAPIVNQGDVVTIILTAADDGVGDGHSFRLETYANSSHPVNPGDEPMTIQFTAHTAGEFTYFCSRFCGSGHSGMHGTFTVLAVQPLSVEDVSPSTGPTSGGTTVTIEGTSFASGATVKFGTLPAASVEVISPSEIRAVTPPGPFDFVSTRMVDVIVTNPDGASAKKSFTWSVPAPSIASLSPPAGTKSGGTLVTIRGGGFSTAVPASVTFGGIAATEVTVVDAVTLRARTPAHTPGRVDVAVTTSKGSTSSAGGYTFSSSRRRAVRP